MNIEARELHLYAENTGELYNQRKLIEKNLTIKKVSGKFDADKAAKLWMYWVDAAAKRYVKEYGESKDWNKMFPKASREQVARALVTEFNASYREGEFESYIPKKYQAKPAKKTARRK